MADVERLGVELQNVVDAAADHAAAEQNDTQRGSSGKRRGRFILGLTHEGGGRLIRPADTEGERSPLGVAKRLRLNQGSSDVDGSGPGQGRKAMSALVADGI